MTSAPSTTCVCGHSVWRHERTGFQRYRCWGKAIDPRSCPCDYFVPEMDAAYSEDDARQGA